MRRDWSHSKTFLRNRFLPAGWVPLMWLREKASSTAAVFRLLSFRTPRLGRFVICGVIARAYGRCTKRLLLQNGTKISLARLARKKSFKMRESNSELF